MRDLNAAGSWSIRNICGCVLPQSSLRHSIFFWLIRWCTLAFVSEQNNPVKKKKLIVLLKCRKTFSPSNYAQFFPKALNWFAVTWHINTWKYTHHNLTRTSRGLAFSYNQFFFYAFCKIRRKLFPILPKLWGKFKDTLFWLSLRIGHS